MNWEKIGNIFNPEELTSTMHSHASNPTVVCLNGSVHRVFFSSRDKENRAHINFVDLDFNQNFKILNFSKEAIVSLGESGAFDDNGMSIGCITEIKGRHYLYYLGWNLGKNVPFRNSIGKLKLNSSLDKAERLYKGPILDRSIHDPFSISYPFILKINDKHVMYYGSHEKWGKTTDDMIHSFKLATSTNGLSWETNEDFIIKANNVDYAFSRPFVRYQNGQYEMYYSYRGHKYRIGFATSNDGYNWKRADSEFGLGVSDSGWDSEMVCYPFLVKYKERDYLFYNGNKYGKTGFGIACLDI